MSADSRICKHMDAYGCIWMPVATRPQVTPIRRARSRAGICPHMVAYACIWPHMCAYSWVCTWTHMDPYGCSWLHGHKSPQFTVRAAGLTFGRVWLHMDAYGRQCLHIHAYTCIWTHMHAYGRMWLHMDAFDFRLCFRSLTDRRPLM